MTAVNMFQITTPDGRKQAPPLFAHLVRITSIKQKHAQGTSYNFVLRAAEDGNLRDSLLAVDDDRFLAGKEMAGMVKRGFARLDRAQSPGGSGATQEDPLPPASEDNVPY